MCIIFLSLKPSQQQATNEDTQQDGVNCKAPSFIQKIVKNPCKALPMIGALTAACYTGHCWYIGEDSDKKNVVNRILIGLPLVSIVFDKLLYNNKVKNFFIVDVMASVSLASVSEFSPYSSNAKLSFLSFLYAAYKGWLIYRESYVSSQIPNNFNKQISHPTAVLEQKNNNLELDPQEEQNKNKLFLGQQNILLNLENKAEGTNSKDNQELLHEHVTGSILKSEGEQVLSRANNLSGSNMSVNEENQNMLDKGLACLKCFSRLVSEILFDNEGVYRPEDDECKLEGCKFIPDKFPHLYKKYKAELKTILPEGKKLSKLQRFIVLLGLATEDTCSSEQAYMKGYIQQITYELCCQADEKFKN